MARPGEGYAWRIQRRRILRRDQGMCQLRLDGCAGYANQVHHLYGWTEGATASDDELVAACWPCNRKTGRPTGDPAPRPPQTNW